MVQLVQAHMKMRSLKLNYVKKQKEVTAAPSEDKMSKRRQKKKKKKELIHLLIKHKTSYATYIGNRKVITEPPTLINPHRKK